MKKQILVLFCIVFTIVIFLGYAAEPAQAQMVSTVSVEHLQQLLGSLIKHIFVSR